MKHIVKDKHERIITIQNSIENPIKTESITFRDERRNIPVIRIPIDLPLYRAENGRIIVDQSAIIIDCGYPPDYFVKGEENITVQKTLHEILFKMSKSDKGPIYQELQHVKEQTESLLLTIDGIVVNGNRRLAAMRALFTESPAAFQSFSHVNVAILPAETTDFDLEMLETELQLVPNTKLDYSWIADLKTLHRQLIDRGIDRQIIKKKHRYKREQDMNDDIQMLELVDEYLCKYLKKPNDYRLVEKSEQIFKEMQKCLKGKSGADGEVRRLVAFILVKEAQSLGSRAYDFKEMFGKSFDKVMTRFASEENIDLKNVPAEGAQLELDEDPLSGLSATVPTSFTALKPIFSDPENSAEHAKKLVKVFESVRNTNSEKEAKLQALKKVQEAFKLLDEIVIATSDPNTHRQIEGQLHGIVQCANRLLTSLSKVH